MTKDLLTHDDKNKQQKFSISTNITVQTLSTIKNSPQKMKRHDCCDATNKTVQIYFVTLLE